MTDTLLNLVVALPAEAKVINQRLGLRRRQPDCGLPVYTGAGIALVLCGPGMDAASRGVDLLHRMYPNPLARWLNVGIAGHLELPLGAALLASQVSSLADGRQWQLSPLKGLNCLRGEVISVTQPCLDYPPHAACDMEAAGFVKQALELADRERVQVLKIISDNRIHPASAINGKMVKGLLQNQSILIRQLVQRLLNPDV